MALAAAASVGFAALDGQVRWRAHVTAAEAAVDEERARERAGHPRWQAKHFGGHYHRKRLRAKHPIVGSALAGEAARELGQQEAAARAAESYADIERRLEDRLRAAGDAAEAACAIKFKFQPRVYAQRDIAQVLSQRRVELAKVQRRFAREKAALQAKGEATQPALRCRSALPRS